MLENNRLVVLKQELLIFIQIFVSIFQNYPKAVHAFLRKLFLFRRIIFILLINFLVNKVRTKHYFSFEITNIILGNRPLLFCFLTCQSNLLKFFRDFEIQWLEIRFTILVFNNTKWAIIFHIYCTKNTLPCRFRDQAFFAILFNSYLSHWAIFYIVVIDAGEAFVYFGADAEFESFFAINKIRVFFNEILY